MSTMTNPTTRIAAAALLAVGLLAVAPSASATHAYNRCTNDEVNDTWIGILGVGVDGPLLDGNGIQVCIGPTAYSVESTVNPPGWDGADPPPAGGAGSTSVLVRVCYNDGAHYEECNELGGGTILLGWTGVIVSCHTFAGVCVYVDGDQVV